MWNISVGVYDLFISERSTLFVWLAMWSHGQGWQSLGFLERICTFFFSLLFRFSIIFYIFFKLLSIVSTMPRHWGGMLRSRKLRLHVECLFRLLSLFLFFFFFFILTRTIARFHGRVCPLGMWTFPEEKSCANDEGIFFIKKKKKHF